MNLVELIAELNRRKIELWIDDWTEDEESISFFWPHDGLPESLVVCIHRHEEALKDMVRAKNSLVPDDWTPEQHTAFKIKLDAIMSEWQATAQQKEHS
jgi:hypothetical protein